MKLNEYQMSAMRTCLPSCENEVYMLNGLTAEVGEVNDKVAKWVRKGLARIDENRLVFNTTNEQEVEQFRTELIKEIGDCLWFLAGLSAVLGWDFADVAKVNLAKLANRKKEGTIITHKDH